jgi:hypothetical protein
MYLHSYSQYASGMLVMPLRYTSTFIAPVVELVSCLGIFNLVQLYIQNSVFCFVDYILKYLYFGLYNIQRQELLSIWSVSFVNYVQVKKYGSTH